MLKQKLLASALTLAILGSALSAAGCGNSGRHSGGQDVSEEAWVTSADKSKDKNAAGRPMRREMRPLTAARLRVVRRTAIRQTAGQMAAARIAAIRLTEALRAL